jgi:hypothetical protein
MTVDDVTSILEGLADDAFRVYQADRKAGADAVTVAWNAGRYDAFKQALDVLLSKGGKSRSCVQQEYHIRPISEGIALYGTKPGSAEGDAIGRREGEV